MKFFNFNWGRKEIIKKEEKKDTVIKEATRTPCEHEDNNFSEIIPYLDKVETNEPVMEYRCYKLVLTDYAVYLVLGKGEEEHNFFNKFIELKDVRSMSWNSKFLSMIGNMKVCFVLVEKDNGYMFYKKNMSIDLIINNKKVIIDYDFHSVQTFDPINFSIRYGSKCVLCSKNYEKVIPKRSPNVEDYEEDGVVLYFNYEILSKNTCRMSILEFKMLLMNFFKEYMPKNTSEVLTLEIDYALVGFLDALSAFLFSIKIYEVLSNFVSENFRFSIAIVKGRYYFYTSPNGKKHFAGQALNKAARVGKLELKNIILFDSEIYESIIKDKYDILISKLLKYTFKNEGMFTLRGFQKIQELHSISKKIVS